MEQEQNYTYLVQCADGSLYCGWTNHLDARVRAHNAGTGAKYTKSRRPVTLVYYEAFATKQEAMKREWAVKQLTRREKLELIAGWQQPCEKEYESLKEAVARYKKQYMTQVVLQS